MSRYIIVHKNEIRDSLLKDIGYKSSKSFTVIHDAWGNETSYYVGRIQHDRTPDELSKYKIMDRAQLDITVASIKGLEIPDHILRPSVKQSAFQDPEGKRARFKGAIKFTIPAGETISQDFIITEKRLITGAIYKVQGSNFGDFVELEVIHPILGPCR